MSLQSENINELIQALAKAQGEISAAPKSSNNPYYNSKYADLTSVWNACREPLSKNGLAVVQTMNNAEDGKLYLITTLAHSSGQWIKSSLPIIFNEGDTEINKYGKEIKSNPLQKMGSSVTYLRRYALAAIVGIAPEDDDGEGAIDRVEIKKNEDKKEVTKIEPIDNRRISKLEVTELTKIIKEFDEETQKKINAYIANVLKATTYEDLTINSMPVLYKKINITREQIKIEKSGTHD